MSRPSVISQGPEPLLADFRFERLQEIDLPMLHEWLRRAHVARWWGPASSVDELREGRVPTAGYYHLQMTYRPTD